MKLKNENVLLGFQHVDWYVVTNISKDHDDFVFSVKQSSVLGLFDLKMIVLWSFKNIIKYLPV
jgi:hypothetical protein